jgi:hypothetical protein
VGVVEVVGRQAKRLGPNGTTSSDRQGAKALSAIHKHFGYNFAQLKAIPATEWSFIIRQVYGVVSSAGQASRVDTFNGNYGLHRGIAASCIVLFGSCLWSAKYWPNELILAGLFCVALMRMHRFGRLYARELFMQFITIDFEAAAQRVSLKSDRPDGDRH